MKAVIPVAGAGTRLRPHTYTQPKPLIPVAGKPIISFIIDQLIGQGVTDFVFIIGYLGEKIQLYIEREYPIKEVDQLLSIIDKQIKSEAQTHGEYQLTDALMGLINQDIKISGVPVNNWFDCGKSGVLLETNAMLLDKEGYASSNLPHYDNTIIIHPVSIGKGCEITNSIVGPHVTIGHNTQINYSIVKDSIIGNYARIEEVVLQSSLVGSDAAIKGLRQSLNIGDNTEIDFS